MVWLKHCLLIILSSLLFACGGDGSVDLSGGDDGGDDGGDNGSSTAASLGIALYSCADSIDATVIPTGCEQTNTVPSDTATYVVVTLSNTSPIANELVNLSTSSAELDAQTILIGSNGVGHTTMKARTDATNADSVVATYSYESGGETTSVTAAENYQVQINSGGNGGTNDLQLALYDCNGVARDQIPVGCSSTNSLSIETPITAVASLSYTGGTPAANELISLSTTNADLSAETILTDVNGLAIATLFAQLETTGADSIVASNSQLGVSASANYQVGQANLIMTLTSSLADGETLGSDATASFTATITDSEGELYATPIAISFASSCSAQDLANISDSVTTVNGVATAIYQADGCSGSDTITVTPSISVIDPQNYTIDIATTKASGITFTSASPQTIYLKESVGETIAELLYVVTDATGSPKSGQEVTFTLDSSLHGVTISPLTAQSNASGEVLTRVTSGNMSGSVVVSASFSDPDTGNIISATSNALAVHTGVPSQQSMSLSASTLALEAWGIDGVDSTVTLRVSDENNNPVPNDTTIVFESDGGQVSGNCKTDGQDTNSGCSVNWVSQNPRPKGHLYDLPAGYCNAPGYIPGDVVNTQGNNLYGVGRASVLASTVGQEYYSDVNGNRIYDAGETFTALGEAFVDSNENGSYDVGGIINHDSVNVEERFRDYNENNEFDNATGVKDSSIPANAITELYNGLSCTVEADASGLCTRNLVEVRDSVVLIMGTSGANILISDTTNSAPVSSVDLTAVSSQGLVVTVQDLNGNQMPAGTTVSISTNNGELSGQTSFTVPDGVRLCDLIGLSVIQESSPNNRSEGTMTVTVTSPGGVESSRSITIIDAG
ncbi:Ig-like domain-containing protein [Agarivorans sp. TSD2052]|uniref:Ig-like domain-containing protein n=1 Tax=Agarivorans sp. TSD2052 TaxID=2937286 RepID=UPI00200BEC9B|nr:Ig-like domain-containing protein [Agarivorans sp. TSD2052]UPW19146.1 Ig-like domain-containing protein [Agarivorans sp. TSD2052]